ncbi:MAG TPA: nucleotide exchange factor GrpE [Candidatus Hydrogenedentes bacterium]|nr:nucleotide exchange factor GrpE [Candidatus Hydrogenedentota bacterium]
MKKKREKIPQKTELEKRLEEEVKEHLKSAASGEAEEAVGAEVAAEEGTLEAVTDAEAAAALTSERDELRDQLLRLRAEFDNFRKRMAREAERVRKTAAEALLLDVLPVVDHLELALEHAGGGNGALAEGVAMVLEQFHAVLKRNGVEPIPALGEAFDPNVHEAVMQMASEDVPQDCVMQEFQKGYMLGGMVLRPSKVVVSSGPPEDGTKRACDASAANAEE